MELENRKLLLLKLSEYMLSKEEEWMQVREKAFEQNRWFIPEFISLSVESIAQNFLQAAAIDELIRIYNIPSTNQRPKKVGIVMAGNIPLVGFHDFLCVFITGHIAVIKASSKDDVLIKRLVKKMMEWNLDVHSRVQFGEQIKGCDAYIATGSNNTSRYFEYYFQKYPNIIRRNRTSAAIINGNESHEELEKLADDVYQYFGLGCRNVTKLHVPGNYNFVPLLEAFKKYNYLIDHNKYKNNYDYNLAILLLNNVYYMTNGSILLVENESLFSPISQLHYEYYNDKQMVQKKLHDNEALQCVVSDETTGFGKAQQPSICEFADGVDTMNFLRTLSEV